MNAGVKVLCLATWRTPNRFSGRWTMQDSNLRPAGYEPAALTNWANGPDEAGIRPIFHKSNHIKDSSMFLIDIVIIPYFHLPQFFWHKNVGYFRGYIYSNLFALSHSIQKNWVDFEHTSSLYSYLAIITTHLNNFIRIVIASVHSFSINIFFKTFFNLSHCESERS